MKRNPRKLSWTLFYRRLRKKGTQEDVLKKAKKRIVTSSAMTRGIAGLSIDELKAKKSEAPERRKAMREAPPPRGRMPKTLTARERMDRKLLTKRGRGLYRLRGQTVEPVFGQMKETQRADGFMMRGKEEAQEEFQRP